MKELSLHILDILSNSVRARADFIELTITESCENNIYKMVFKDNGTGMDSEMLANVLNPWVTSRKERRVGMGLSMFRQNAELCGGYLTIDSKTCPEPESGTCVEVMLEHDHMDRPIAGDIPGSIVAMVSSWPDIEFLYTHVCDAGSYTFDTRQVKEMLDGVSINNAPIIKALNEMILENLVQIGAETTNPREIKSVSGL